MALCPTIRSSPTSAGPVAPAAQCPIVPMHTLERTDQRLTELEIKSSFTEDALDQLDKIIVRQQAQIDALIREVTHLRQQASEPATARNQRDDLPPHY